MKWDLLKSLAQLATALATLLDFLARLWLLFCMVLLVIVVYRTSQKAPPESTIPEKAPGQIYGEKR